MGGGILPTQSLVTETEPLPTKRGERLTASGERDGDFGVEFSGPDQEVHGINAGFKRAHYSSAVRAMASTSPARRSCARWILMQDWIAATSPIR